MLQVVSDDNLAMLVRQIALHCNLAANIYSNMQRKAVRCHVFLNFLSGYAATDLLNAPPVAGPLRQQLVILIALPVAGPLRQQLVILIALPVTGPLHQ